MLTKEYITDQLVRTRTNQHVKGIDAVVKRWVEKGFPVKKVSPSVIELLGEKVRTKISDKVFTGNVLVEVAKHQKQLSVLYCKENIYLQSFTDKDVLVSMEGIRAYLNKNKLWQELMSLEDGEKAYQFARTHRRELGLKQDGPDDGYYKLVPIYELPREAIVKVVKHETHKVPRARPDKNSQRGNLQSD
jgi:hypothetical protein